MSSGAKFDSKWKVLSVESFDNVNEPSEHFFPHPLKRDGIYILQFFSFLIKTVW